MSDTAPITSSTYLNNTFILLVIEVKLTTFLPFLQDPVTK